MIVVQSEEAREPGGAGGGSDCEIVTSSAMTVSLCGLCIDSAISDEPKKVETRLLPVGVYTWICLVLHNRPRLRFRSSAYIFEFTAQLSSFCARSYTPFY
jgi:hypothetical protein